jgi:hypothetical protein
MAKRNYCDENGRCTASGAEHRQCSHYERKSYGWICDAKFIKRECTNPAAIQAAKEANNEE